METAVLNDLVVHVGKPYFYVHQGNCEHVIIFTDIRVLRVMTDTVKNGEHKPSVATTAEAFELITEISDRLNTGLDHEELLICSNLIESGVNPMALAAIVQTAMKAAQQVTQSR